MRRTTRAALAALAMTTTAALAAPVPAEAAAPVRSTWDSDFGPLELVVSEDGEVSGVYPDYGGRLTGAYVDFIMDELYATWVQPASEVRCDTTVEGSRHWGRVTWRADGPDRLSGTWTYCDDVVPENAAWTARRTSALPPPPPPAEPATEADLLEAQRVHFGTLAKQPETQTLHADVTCDGALDVVAGVVSENVELGPFYDVMILSRGGTGPAEPPVPEGVRLPFGDMLCGPVRPPELAVEVPEGTTTAEAVGWPGCAIQVQVIDGMCDIHRLLWLGGREPGGRLLYTRL